MKITKMKRAFGPSSSLGSVVLFSATGAAMLLIFSGQARAFEIETDNPDLSLRWDTSIKYSNAFRLEKPDSKLIADANQDDGDRNFGRGLISNRFDVLSEFDAAYKSMGARVSTSGWYDTVYNRSNDNDSPQTANATSVANDEFVNDTQDISGRDIQLLDAFVYKKGSVSDMPYTVRLGQHSVLYGETLFFGSNGIAGAQSPTDVNKLLSVPNTQFKELVLPQPQISGQIQLQSNVTIGGYYQFAWHPDRLPPVGSYFSNSDLLQEGAERILLGPPLVPGGGPAAFFHGKDLKGSDSGQGGLQLRWRPDFTDAEFGFYAARYNAKTPNVYVRPGDDVNPASGQIGTYQLVYPDAITTIGASFTKSVDETNFAGELSFRHNMPLVSDPVTIAPGEKADNDGHARYAVGNTLHANFSWVTALPRTAFWDGGSLLGEVAYNQRLSISKNPEALDPNTTKRAAALRVVFSPTYFQVLPGLDLNVPIGIGYTPYGRSSVISSFNGGSYQGGDLSIGVSAVYQQQWNMSLSLTHYLGGADTYLGPANQAVQKNTFGQTSADRDFIAFSVSRSF
ncbi:DUF1302 domain-containing protein [Pseudomonas thivervalensis]|uniref:DUF1302 domain-containing protein n=1 Tax=Pseudomonas thivervalensis TaxID=86265 RepID=UPI0009E8481D|nr:DUF1302 domain-containing protein [Pseudomonas thivervalensis]